MPDDIDWICQVCKRVLDIYAGPDGVELRHTPIELAQGVDHEPVPIKDPGAKVGAYRCDFCSAEDPRWVLPARTFDVPDVPYDDRTDTYSSGNWAACDDCADLIRRNRWNDLAARAAARFSAPVSRFNRWYRLLRKNVTGDLVPLR